MNRLWCLAIVAAVACNEQQPHSEVASYPVSAATMSKEIKREQTNSQEAMQAPYVLLISLDGYRYDYAETYGSKTLLEFDVRAEHLISSFPTKTFPNHYTIVTGLYPGNHGLVSNTFYDSETQRTYRISDRDEVTDPSWYKGTPLWVLASEQDMVTASMFWVGSEAPIQGVLPTYYYKYDGSVSHMDRVNKVLQWFSLPEDIRPHLVTLYFSEIDSKGHTYGPESAEIREAVTRMEGTLSYLMKELTNIGLPVNVIVVSDHGMQEIMPGEQVTLSKYIDIGSEVVTFSMPVMLYSDDSELVQNTKQNLLSAEGDRVNVYTHEEIPEAYHLQPDSRVGNLIIMPKPPHVVTANPTTPAPGSSTHGWDPAATAQMGAIFYANGPAFNKADIEPFENIHIYPTIAAILGLEIDFEIDGNPAVLQPILKD